jgi:hypothetical protein
LRWSEANVHVGHGNFEVIVMKKSAWKIAFAVALFASLVGTSRTSLAIPYGPGQSFDLYYDMSAPPYNYPSGYTFTDLSYEVWFPDGQITTSGESLNFQLIDSSNNVLTTFGYQLPVDSDILAIGGGNHPNFATTDPVGYLMVTLGPNTSFTGVDLGLPSYAALAFGPYVTPLPAALPLFATGLCVMGLFGWRRKRKSAAALATA